VLDAAKCLEDAPPYERSGEGIDEPALPRPLGARQLVRASTGKLIRYHIGHF